LTSPIKGWVIHDFGPDSNWLGRFMVLKTNHDYDYDYDSEEEAEEECSRLNLIANIIDS
jgi:hypothetical protein